jgi:hypothetical protein
MGEVSNRVARFVKALLSRTGGLGNVGRKSDQRNCVITSNNIFYDLGLTLLCCLSRT